MVSQIENLFKENRNLHKIDKILQNLTFFRRYPDSIRMALYEMGELKVYSEDETVFNQGEPSDMFFVVLRGSCKQI